MLRLIGSSDVSQELDLSTPRTVSQQSVAPTTRRLVLYARFSLGFRHVTGNSFAGETNADETKIIVFEAAL